MFFTFGITKKINLEKFEIDIKWGSYLFITNLLVSFAGALIMVLADIDSLRYIYNILVFLFIIQLFYFTIKAIKEKTRYDMNTVFRKPFVFIKVFGFYLFLFSIVEASRINNASSFPSPFTKEELLKLSIVDDDSNESNSNLLQDLIFRLKGKFNRL